MESSIRNALAVLAGVVIGAAIISLIEAISPQLFPTSPRFDLTNPEAMRQFTGSIPTGAKLLVLLAWFLGTVTGTYTGIRIAAGSQRRIATIMGALFLLIGVVNMATIPFPLWFWCSGIVIFIGGTYLALTIANYTTHQNKNAAAG